MAELAEHAGLTDFTETDFYDDKPSVFLNRRDQQEKGTHACGQASGSPRRPETQKGESWGCESSPPPHRSLSSFHHLLLSGSASLVQRHALLHTLLSRSLRHEVNIIPDIHLFL